VRPVSVSAVEAEVRRVVAAVEDPEMPVTIADLGMVRGLTVMGGTAVIRLVPTFLACPALWLVESQVKQAATQVAGVASCQVDWQQGGWSGADVTEAGRRALAAAGLAVPAADGSLSCPFCGAAGTEETSPFGSAVCRTAAYCPACQTPFEVLKVKRRG
jgi:ring-1,2-phenylacetyl-CoA epoxidase subunit PaaD